MADEGAAALWAELAAPIRAFVQRRAPRGVDADDVVQEVFLRVHRSLDQLHDVERIDAWIFQIARNALFEAMRTRQRDLSQIDRESEVEQSGAPQEDPREGPALARCLTGMVARLAEPYREAIELTDLDGLTQAAAAEKVGVSLPAMKSRCRRAREQLRSMLLACCEVDVDRRGGVVEFSGRHPSGEACRSEAGSGACRSRSEGNVSRPALRPRGSQTQTVLATATNVERSQR